MIFKLFELVLGTFLQTVQSVKLTSGVAEECIQHAHHVEFLLQYCEIVTSVLSKLFTVVASDVFKEVEQITFSAEETCLGSFLLFSTCLSNQTSEEIIIEQILSLVALILLHHRVLIEALRNIQLAHLILYGLNVFTDPVLTQFGFKGEIQRCSDSSQFQAPSTSSCEQHFATWVEAGSRHSTSTQGRFVECTLLNAKLLQEILCLSVTRHHVIGLLRI